MKPYVEFEYRFGIGITIAGCEGKPIDPATVQSYAEIGNESAQDALAARQEDKRSRPVLFDFADDGPLMDRLADAAEEHRLARRAYRITRQPIAWGRLLRAKVDYRLAHRALHGPPLK